MKKPIIVTLSVVGGVVIGTLFATSLVLARINIPAALARTYSEYNTYSGAWTLVLSIFFGWATYQTLARRFLERKGDDRPYLERLPSWARNPTGLGLIVAWVASVCTVVLYPLAGYMSYRYYIGRRDASKACPRCAERVKAAALVCRYCGQDLEAGATQPTALTPA